MPTPLCVLLLVLLGLASTVHSFSFSARIQSHAQSHDLMRLRASLPDGELNEVWLSEKLPQLEKRMSAINRAMPPLDPPGPPDVQLKRAPATATVSTAGAVAAPRAAPTPQSGKLPLPFMQAELGVAGRWQERLGNYFLLPTSGERPVGVVHFLGGAFVGAAPHLTYRYLLESLADRGYLVVATPYRLDMDYVRICDGVLMKFDALARELAEEFGPLPVIGIGHSCGALLQTLITSLFPDTPRAVNVLISFNNRPAQEAIPTFSELVVPISRAVMGEEQLGVRLREQVSGARSFFRNALKVYSDSPIAPTFVGKELVPLLEQGLEVVEQVPDLLRSIAQGQEEFEPSPADTKEVCRRMYRARRTLVLKFESDTLDESEEIAAVLREANTIMRMKRPMVEMQVELKELKGSHITPLTPNLLLDLARLTPVAVPDLLNVQKTGAVVGLMRTIDDVNAEIQKFLEDSMVNA
eukprot:CAMPEP_0173182712 /NCGR_PEP_ID=MMETSP1141-20130122/7995_1 /TAXON_ID=483371 /ORGANISM="non described non described, Strain CCMP2298" /LENGTH=467 /DNA_ID=CAMNT_0014105847 /DNA_START=401 /DNA_END=1804 /DNA_ORIENTATION=-